MITPRKKKKTNKQKGNGCKAQIKFGGQVIYWEVIKTLLQA